MENPGTSGWVRKIIGRKNKGNKLTKSISSKEYNKLMDEVIKNNSDLPIDELLLLLLNTCNKVKIKGFPQKKRKK